MINVTEAARSRLAQALEAMEDVPSPDACFRIEPGDGEKLTLAVGSPQPEDITFDEKDRTILAVSPAVAEACGERTLDVAPEGPGGRAVLTLS